MIKKLTYMRPDPIDLDMSALLYRLFGVQKAWSEYFTDTGDIEYAGILISLRPKSLTFTFKTWHAMLPVLILSTLNRPAKALFEALDKAQKTIIHAPLYLIDMECLIENGAPLDSFKSLRLKELESLV